MLKPKRVAEYRKVWLQLKDNGYDVIPLVSGKNKPLYKWPEIPNDTAAISTWNGRAAAVRMYGSQLFVIDVDITIESVRDAVVAMLEKTWPEFMKACLRRHSGAVKIAFIGRIEATARLIPTWRFTDPADTSEKPPGQRVEVFNGLTKQYVAVHGAHSPGREYGYHGRSILETVTDDLPWFPAADVGRMLAACEEIMAAHGLTAIVPEGGKATGPVVYDITAATRFDVNDGPSQISYDELCDLYLTRGEIRVSSSFIDGGSNRSKCRVGDCKIVGTICVYDNEDAAWHCPVEADPGRVERALAEGLKALAAQAPAPAPPRPDDAASMDDKKHWLLLNYGYCASSHTVVELHKADASCHLAPAAYQMLYRAWREEIIGKRGGKSYAYATGGWEVSPGRVDIEGARMRPDRPFPIYVEDGLTFKNTYRRPQHNTEGGDLTEFNAFMERFLPDPIEREWLLDWMAHKQWKPEIPGTAVIFVADNTEGVRVGRFGTGRGLLSRVAYQLYGPQYARPQSFSVLDGTSSQSVFNDWIHGSVLVTVDESRTSGTAYRRGERSAVYEVLKDIVDPAPKKMDFKGKHRASFTGMSYCSYWIATNHADAVAIPATDRRFTVLRNGRTITPVEATAFVAWLENPDNIGALSRMLAARDLSGFRMFDPLDTSAKADMAEYAITPVEEYLYELMDDDTLGLVFTRADLTRWVAHNFKESPTRWQGDLDGSWSRVSKKAIAPDTGHQRRIRVGGTQKKLFCFPNRAAAAQRLPEAAIQREVLKWLHPNTAVTQLPGLALVSGSQQKDEKDQ